MRGKGEGGEDQVVATHVAVEQGDHVSEQVVLDNVAASERGGGGYHSSTPWGLCRAGVYTTVMLEARLGPEAGALSHLVAGSAWGGAGRESARGVEGEEEQDLCAVAGSSE